MSDAIYLAIDQGGHASRVMVFDAQGNVVAEATREVVTSYSQRDWVEQDGDSIERSIQEALDEVAGVLGEKCHTIVAAGLATQRSNVVCWDRETGRALSPVISWQDRRAHHWMQQFDSQSRLIQQITGLLPTAHYGVSKLTWCLQHLSEVQGAHTKNILAWGPLSSFLLFRLLDKQPILVDPANASRTLLWDIEQCDWSQELLKLFGMTDDGLPECVPSRFNFGNLNVGGYKVPLKVCTGDQSAALFAFGKPVSGVVSVNIGTGAFLQTIHTKNIPERSAEDLSSISFESSGKLLKSIVWADAENSIVVSEATVNGAGCAMQLVENQLHISPHEAQKLLPNWLASSKDIPLYLNGVSGLGSPYWQPDFESRFIGDGEPAEKLVAVIESIVFLIQVNLEEMKKYEIILNQIKVSGGLSVLDGLCQRLADLGGISVSRPEECEATAKGLAFLVSGREQPWSTEESDFFMPETNAELMSRYRHWKKEIDDALAEGAE